MSLANDQYAGLLAGVGFTVALLAALLVVQIGRAS